MKYDRYFRHVSISLIWVWLGVFSLLSFLLVFVVSLLQHDQQHIVAAHFTLENYYYLLQPAILRVFEKSFLMACFSTMLCLLIAYPFSYCLSQVKTRFKPLLLMILIIPFWTSSLVRSYAIMALLKTKGLLNGLLVALGIIHQPMQILFTNTAVLIGLVYNLLPFMILPIYSSFERMDDRLIEAAKDLGASSPMIFYQLLLPLTKPGIYAGIVMVFLPAMTLFFIPDLLGGAKSMLLGNLIEQQFMFANNWPVGAAISIMLTAVMAVMLVIYWRNSQRNQRQVLL